MGHYHILSLEGMPGTGKTQVAASAPGKVGIYSTDGRWNGVVQKFPEWQERFLVENYFPVVDLSADLLFKEGGRENDADKKQEGVEAAIKQKVRLKRELWDPFKKDWKEGMTGAEVRTLVMDQADEFKQYLRLVNFGKIEQNPQMASGPVNVEYKSLLQDAHKYHKNLVLVHQMKQKYKKVVDITGTEKSEKVEGVFESTSSLGVEYLIHSFVRTYHRDPVRDAKTNEIVKPGEFSALIMNAKLNPEANGMVIPLDDPERGWQTLMMFLAPDVPAEVWE